MKKYLVPLLLAAALLAAGCGGSEEEPQMTQTPQETPEPQVQRAQPGDKVSVHYTGTLEDGSQFDSSVGKQPLQFTIGSGMVIAGFDQAVRGLAVGESRRVVIPPEDAYGKEGSHPLAGKSLTFDIELVEIR